MNTYTQDIRLYYTRYAQEASAIFSRLFNEFQNETEKVDRDGDENVFQLLRGKYNASLKTRLERTAGLLINECNAEDMKGRLRINFTESISYLLKEFKRKSGSL